MNKRFNRQSFLGPKSTETFKRCHVAIIGLGGGGSHVAQQLAHLGVENFGIFDPDHVDESNLNRMVGATYEDAIQKKPKAQVISGLIKGINPLAGTRAVEKKWQEQAELLRTSDVIFGCVDTFAERDQIERAARRYLTPYIDIGMDVHEVGDQYAIAGQVILSMPGELCMRCLGFLRDDLLAQEAAQYGAAGGRPQVVWPNGLLASLAVGVFVQLVTPWHKEHRKVVYLEYDGNGQTVATSNRMKHLQDATCPHFSGYADLGDPFWRP